MAASAGRTADRLLRPESLRRLKIAGIITGICAACLPILSRLTSHRDEAVILLMPPALAAYLWFAWPAVRRIPWWKHGLYVLVMVPVLAGAEYFVAKIARGRMLWPEVFWALYFMIAWRLAWSVWKGTVSGLGERYRRWGRRTRTAGDRLQGAESLRRKQRVLARTTTLIRPGRLLLTLLIFVPLAFGSLIHRIKIGNPAHVAEYPGLHLESVSFRTDDGLMLSGWFLPEPNSDSTVVICHGAGANKYNFLEFMLLFRYQGYNSLIFDFRGHGASQGHTSTFGLDEDADVKAAVDWLKKNRPDQSRHVYGLGSSMGAMALVRAAAKDPRIEAVILDSCFVSAPLLAREHLGRIPLLGRPLATMLLASLSLHAGRSFWSLDATQAIHAIAPRPVLLIHGKDDTLIPPVNMEILYSRARQPKDKWLGPGPHSNIMTSDFLGYQRRVIAFLDKAKAGAHDR